MSGSTLKTLCYYAPGWVKGWAGLRKSGSTHCAKRIGLGMDQSASTDGSFFIITISSASLTSSLSYFSFLIIKLYPKIRPRVRSLLHSGWSPSPVSVLSHPNRHHNQSTFFFKGEGRKIRRVEMKGASTRLVFIIQHQQNNDRHDRDDNYAYQYLYPFSFAWQQSGIARQRYVRYFLHIAYENLF